MDASTINIRNDLCCARSFRALWFAETTGLSLVTPEDGVIRDCNSTFAANLGGRSRAEIIGKTFMELTHPDDLNEDLAMVRKCIAGEMDSYSMHKKYIDKERNNSGETSYTENLLCVVSVRDKLGQVEWFVSATTQLTIPPTPISRFLKTLSLGKVLAALGAIAAGLFALSDNIRQLVGVLKINLGSG